MKIKKRLYASIVGLGIGERHLNFLKKNKNIEIISVFDPIPNIIIRATQKNIISNM